MRIAACTCLEATRWSGRTACFAAKRIARPPALASPLREGAARDRAPCTAMSEDEPDRRLRDRRARPRSGSADRSWFGVAGLPMEVESIAGYPGDLTDSQFGSIWSDISAPDVPVPPVASAAAAGSAAKATTGSARLLDAAASAATQRIYRAFLGARAALGVALALTLAAGAFFGMQPLEPVVWVSVAYATLALAMWVWPRFSRIDESQLFSRLRSPQWLATVGADIVCFLALHALSRSTAFNYVALLVLPVMMAAVLSPRRIALATTAFIALGLGSGSFTR